MRRSLCRLWVALLLTSAAPLSSAHAAGDCDNEVDQRGLNDCFAKLAGKSDAELNAVYSQIMARLKSDAATTKLLVAAEKAWVTFRDAECNFSSAGVSGGSAAPMIWAMCLDGQTKARVKDLKAYLNCEEGDLSCPVPRN